MSSRPSILLIPGSYMLPAFYDPLVSGVSAAGYDIKALHLPTVGAAPGEGREGLLATMNDDAALIAGEADKLADEGKDVVLIAHCTDGKQGGIVRIGYITSIVPAVGVSAGRFMADVTQSNGAEATVDEYGWSSVSIPAAAKVTFSDLPPEQGEGLLTRFSAKHSSAAFATELTYAGYKDVPVSHLVCEEDLLVSPGTQRAEIDMIERESRRAVDVTSIQAGHALIARKEREVVDWIVRTAGKEDMDDMV